MIHRIILLALLACYSFASLAQTQVITILRNGQSFFYYNVNELPTLISSNATQPGDTIILPGGGISTPNISLSKPLTIIGAGALVPGTPVTERTVWTSTTSTPGTPGFYISGPASGSAIHGIVFQTAIRFSGGEGINSPSFNLSFVRCVFNSSINLSTFGQFSIWTQPPQNLTIKHCVINNGIGNSSGFAPNGFNIANSIISGTIGLSSNALLSGASINQCVIIGPISLGNNPGLTYSNNIFVKNESTAYNFSSSASNFLHNLFSTASGPPTLTLGSGNNSDNVTSTAQGLFVSVPNFNVFSATANYQLIDSGAASGIGISGYDAGIYDGPPGNPWKELAIPFNPHWQDLQPSGNLGTTQGGTINVTIQGAAQEN